MLWQRKLVGRVCPNRLLNTPSLVYNRCPTRGENILITKSNFGSSISSSAIVVAEKIGRKWQLKSVKVSLVSTNSRKYVQYH
jgi:hypothetical protein